MLDFKQVMPMTNNTSGWTLLESIVVIVISGVLAAAVIPKFSPMHESLKLRTAAYNVQRSLLAARTRAIADPSIHCGVVFKDSTTIIIYPDTSGTPYIVNLLDTASKYLGTYKMPKNIFLKEVSDSNHCIVFRGDGSAKYGGSVYVYNKYNIKRTISVLATTGRIKVQ
jgi:prepilin-type N-terminal cleavage/methylation domain-containing protein